MADAPSEYPALDPVIIKESPGKQRSALYPAWPGQVRILQSVPSSAGVRHGAGVATTFTAMRRTEFFERGRQPFCISICRCEDLTVGP